LSPSANLASMINRMACSHRCETDQPTSNETGTATENTSGPDEEPPQLLHALVDECVTSMTSEHIKIRPARPTNRLNAARAAPGSFAPR
jgi:hypothetical protein